MKTFLYTITDPIGMHARPAGLLAQAAAAYQSLTMLHSGLHSGLHTADACDAAAVLRMGLRCGDTITVTVQGPDETAAAAVLEQFFKARL